MLRASRVTIYEAVLPFLTKVEQDFRISTLEGDLWFMKIPFQERGSTFKSALLPPPLLLLIFFKRLVPKFPSLESLETAI